MRILTRTSLALVIAAAPLLALSQTATAVVTDCTYTKSKKLVTLSIDNSDTTGSLVIERSLGTKKIGYRAEGASWKGCEGARTDDTNKIKVLGSSLSEDIYINLGNGGFAPGASSENTGASEIEFSLSLEEGTDTVTLMGGRGSDRLAFGKPTLGFLNGDDDADVNMTGVNAWRLDGGAGDDVLNGSGAPRVEVYGREGADRLFGGDGADELYGDAGDEAGDRDDVLNAGAGDDRLYGYRGSDVLLGGDGDDSLYGQENNDDVRGGAGNDSLDADDSRDGADDLDGGSGNDLVAYWDRSANLRVTLDGKPNDGAKRERDDVAGNVERVYAGSGNDTLVGNNAPNSLIGADGNDVLKGLGGEDSLDDGAGNDEVYGGLGDESFGSELGDDEIFGGEGDDGFYTGNADDGSDRLSGGPGVDTVNYTARTVGLFIDVSSGADDGEPGEGDAVRDDFEYIYGGNGSDLIRGSNADEYISGGGSVGADVINGRGGSDSLEGNSGNDHLIGSEGFDAMYGEDGDDTIEAQDNGEDYVDCGSGAADSLSTRDSFDQYTGCENVVM